MIKKKGNASSTIAIWILVIVVVGLGGGVTWYMLQPPAITTPTPTAVAASNAGDQGTLKLSAQSITDSPIAQIASTGYCWDIANPKALLESSSGKTLSATTGTPFGTAYRQHNYACTSFSSSLACDHGMDDKGDTCANGGCKMVDEGLNIRVNCENVTTSSGLFVEWKERGTAETTNSLTIPAGTSKSYNEFYLEVNVSDFIYPFKAMCFGSNVSSSHVADLTLAGFTKDNDVPDYLSGNADDYCYMLTSAVKLTEGAGKIFPNTFTVKADSTGFSANERLNVTIHDECEYVADDGSIQKDYFKRNTVNQNDCGSAAVTGTIDLIT